MAYLSPVTEQNYDRLIKSLKQNDVKTVLVQYPLRSVKLLKRIVPPGYDVTLVDNEIVFREALLKGSYGDYFTDRFAMDFGHCTPEGNKLLAENVARTIIDELNQ